MKNLILLLLFLFVSIVLSAQHTKRALIIAVGDYHKTYGWNALSSVNDAEVIKQTMQNQGFKEENIMLLKNEQATKTNIAAAFDKLATSVTGGDYVVIHFSGHGQQIQDDNADEADGFDEALIPIDAPAQYSESPLYTGQNHFRDDELNKKIEALRKKAGKGGQILVILDACHSGTGTRGEAVSRGGKPAFTVPDQARKLPKKSDKDNKNQSDMVESQKSGQSNLASLIVISSSKADEVSFETVNESGDGIGSLSYAVTKAFAQMTKDDNYLSLFAHIKQIMHEKVPYQTPQIEGDMNEKPFNGEVVVPGNYAEILKVDTEQKTLIYISKGELHGFRKGDKIAFYPAGTLKPDEKTPNFSANIIRSEAFFSVVETKSVVAIENIKAYWCYQNAINLENLRYAIYIESDVKSKYPKISELLGIPNPLFR